MYSGGNLIETVRSASEGRNRPKPYTFPCPECSTAIMEATGAGCLIVRQTARATPHRLARPHEAAWKQATSPLTRGRTSIVSARRRAACRRHLDPPLPVCGRVQLLLRAQRAFPNLMLESAMRRARSRKWAPSTRVAFPRRAHARSNTSPRTQARLRHPPPRSTCYLRAHARTPAPILTPTHSRPQQHRRRISRQTCTSGDELHDTAKVNFKRRAVEPTSTRRIRCWRWRWLRRRRCRRHLRH